MFVRARGRNSERITRFVFGHNELIPWRRSCGTDGPFFSFFFYPGHASDERTSARLNKSSLRSSIRFGDRLISRLVATIEQISAIRTRFCWKSRLKSKFKATPLRATGSVSFYLLEQVCPIGARLLDLVHAGPRCVIKTRIIELNKNFIIWIIWIILNTNVHNVSFEEYLYIYIWEQIFLPIENTQKIK